MSDTARPRLVSALAAWSKAAAAEVVVARSAEVVDVDADGCVSVRMLTPIQEVVAGAPRWVEAPILPRIPVAYMSLGDLTITARAVDRGPRPRLGPGRGSRRSGRRTGGRRGLP